MRCLFSLLAVLFGTSPAWAQHMTVVVEPDRILMQMPTGTETVPRYLDLPIVTTVADGDVATLTAGVYDYIEVSGTLNVPAITVNVTHLFVLPGGTMNVLCGATIIGRDVPINTARDPFQWGNGLLNFGRVNWICPELTPFRPLTGDVAQGATTLTLDAAPVGWALGDAVMLPDTRQMNTLGGNNVSARREPNATITAISGTTLTLSTPLAFARASVKRPDGSVVVTPRVTNLTRRSTVRSENPSGVRWHWANVGHDASWDVEGVAFIGMGRTKNEPLNNTSAGSNIGTNQVGRYAFHIHHVWTSNEIRKIAWSSFQGMNGGKWAVAVHQSHDTEIFYNTCVDVPGGCFVTEDGNETRNVFRGNFAAFTVGNGIGSVQNVDRGCPGCESAYWFRGVANIIEGNEAWNSQVGINLFNQRHQGKTNPVPVAKGSMTTTVPNLVQAVPISMTRNVVASNPTHGIEAWSMVPFPNTLVTLAHNGQRQVWSAFPEASSHLYLVDAKIICAGGLTLGVVSGQGYTQGVEMLRGEIRGCAEGLAHGIGRAYGRITETVLQNVANFFVFQPGAWPIDLTFTRVRHEPLGTNKLRYLDSVPVPIWNGTGPYPETGLWSKPSLVMTIIDWQGTGQNYRIAYPAQIRSALAWHPVNPNQWTLPPPECGKTIGDSWDRCRMVMRGETFAPGTQTTLQGVLNMVALPALPTDLGIPKSIMTTPNSSGSFTNTIQSDGQIFLNFALTGDPALADNKGYLSIDGGPRRVTTYRRGGPSSPFFVGIASNVVSNGSHTVRTWRELNGVEVPGSSMTFGYIIGNTPPPPPPVDCVLSPSSINVSDWVLSGNTYTRTTLETKVILTAPANGGAPCQP